jgi:hypothetical protein
MPEKWRGRLFTAAPPRYSSISRPNAADGNQRECRAQLRSCANCIFWARHVDDGRLGFAGMPLKTGQCRRRAPNWGQGVDPFPQTREGSWCGEYEAIDAGLLG